LGTLDRATILACWTPGLIEPDSSSFGVVIVLYADAENIKVRIERLIWLDEIVEKLAKKHGVLQD
jgi:hypothetical protein